MTRTIAAAEFKARCLALLDDVGPEGIVITKRGKPVAKLVAIQPSPAQVIGSFKCKIKIKGAVKGTGLVWNAES